MKVYMRTNESVLTLAVLHKIYLTKKERYALINREKIEVIGVSVPVWFYKGNTSEPATEVFCRYIITNNQEDYPISTHKQGYQINIPQIEEEEENKLILSDEGWRKLPISDKINLVTIKKTQPSAEALKDISDGGAEYLFFKKMNQIEKEGKTMHMIHTVEIMCIEDLEKSFC